MSLTSNAATYASYLKGSLLTSNVDMAVYIEAPHASNAVGYVVHTLQGFVLAIQWYSLVRYFLALRRQSWKPKGRGYDLSVGPAYTYTFPLRPGDGDSIAPPSNDFDDAHVSGHREAFPWCIKGMVG